MRPGLLGTILLLLFLAAVAVGATNGESGKSAIENLPNGVYLLYPYGDVKPLKELKLLRKAKSGDLELEFPGESEIPFIIGDYSSETGLRKPSGTIYVKVPGDQPKVNDVRTAWLEERGGKTVFVAPGEGSDEVGLGWKPITRDEFTREISRLHKVAEQEGEDNPYFYLTVGGEEVYAGSIPIVERKTDGLFIEFCEPILITDHPLPQFALVMLDTARSESCFVLRIGLPGFYAGFSRLSELWGSPQPMLEQPEIETNYADDWNRPELVNQSIPVTVRYVDSVTSLPRVFAYPVKTLNKADYFETLKVLLDSRISLSSVKLSPTVFKVDLKGIRESGPFKSGLKRWVLHDGKHLGFITLDPKDPQASRSAFH